MAATGEIGSIGKSAARLRPAAASLRASPGSPAGPFEPAAPHPKSSMLGQALVTGLLIVYPTFATVAAVVVGFMLSGCGA